MTINWSNVLNDSKVKKMNAMVSKVMDDIKVDDDDTGVRNSECGLAWKGDVK